MSTCRDTEVIIRALLSKEVVHPEYGHVLQDSLVLANDFRIYNFIHIKHVGNSIAHFLTRRAKSGNELQVWLEAILKDIAPLVTRDSL